MCVPGSGCRFRNSEVLADLRCEVVVELTMPWNCRNLPFGAVDEDGVRTAFPKKLTSVFLEMTD
jgi:hypothetical protein